MAKGGGGDKYLIASSFRSLKRGVNCEGEIETLEECQVGRQFVVFLSRNFLGAFLRLLVLFAFCHDAVLVITH